MSDNPQVKPPMGIRYGEIGKDNPSWARAAEAATLYREADKSLRAAMAQMKRASGDLELVQRSCQHHYTDPERRSIYHPSVYCPGDPPGTMGVDRQLPFSTEPRTDVWYEKTCKRCGLVHRTDRTEPTGSVRPVF